MRETETTLRDRLASLATAMGYEFVGCELRKLNTGTLLRIYIDKETGINVDDCSRVSRQVSAMLDVEDPIQGRYTLEVSSPGLDRPLFEMAHYHRFIGREIKVRLYTPLDGRRNFVGVLLRVEEATISMLVEQTEITISFSDIEKAKLIPDLAG
jgi:ribosome maturation factor RimP